MFQNIDSFAVVSAAAVALLIFLAYLANLVGKQLQVKFGMVDNDDPNGIEDIARSTGMTDIHF